MKSVGLAPFAVIVLWLGLSSVWMARTGAPWASEAATIGSAELVAQPMQAAVPSGPVMIDLSWKPPLGPVMTDPADIVNSGQVTAAPRTGADTSAETLARLQSLEARLTLALDRLELSGDARSPLSGVVAAPPFLAQFASVVLSGPVLGFLLLLSLVLAFSTRSRPLSGPDVVLRLKNLLRRLTDPIAYRAGLRRTAIATPDRGVKATRRIYGQTAGPAPSSGPSPQSGVFDENQVRAAAGLTLALGAIAFAYAAIGKVYLPIQVVTILFSIEFLIRVTHGITVSPIGMIAGWMTRRSAPYWVSAKPKRFAWSLGLGMSLAMMIITNVGIRGPLPLTICLICLTLMWLEAVLGLCLGCKIHRYLLRQGWMQPDKDSEICTGDACTIPPQPQAAG